MKARLQAEVKSPSSQDLSKCPAIPVDEVSCFISAGSP